jgi:hypothetical protein
MAKVAEKEKAIKDGSFTVRDQRHGAEVELAGSSFSSLMEEGDPKVG